MSHEAIVLAPPTTEQIQTMILHVPQNTQPTDPAAVLPSQEKVKAVEAVFTHDEREQQMVAGLLGIWTSALVLHDVAVETFDPPADEKEEKAKPKPKLKPED